jgi:tetratricopeptide (TPR) repeat protein
MNNTWFLVIFGMTTAYFGLRTLRILPALLRLLAALRSGAVKWPGPRVHDPDPQVSWGRQHLGWPSEHLFSTFIGHTTGIIAALAFSILSLIGFSQSLVVPRESKAWELLMLTFIVYIGSVISSRRVDHNMDQINILLSDLATGEEPRQINGQSAEAEYAIEHPLIRHQVLWSGSTKALNLYYESLTHLQAGNQRRATVLYQEALNIDPSLHKRARETLSDMAQVCSPTDAGPIYYWLGVHSEYLTDLAQAAVWYEKAIKAFDHLGYKKRQGRAHCNLGNVQAQLGNSSLAMEEFEKAIALNPKDGTAQINIGMLYYGISDPGDPRHEQALDAFADAIVADPETYGPRVISRMRSIGYTWKEDLEKITQRVESKQR